MNTTSFLHVLGGSSLQAGVLVLLVLGVQRVFQRQLTPQWRCSLWLLLVARLLLPISASSVLSVYNLLSFPRETVAASIPASLERMPASRDHGNAAGLAQPNRREHSLPLPVPAEPADLPAASRADSPGAATTPSFTFPWVEVMLGGWLIGVVGLLAQMAFLSARLAHRVNAAAPCTNPNVRRVLAACAEQIGLRDTLVVVESNAVSSPALFGFFRPRLLMPRGFEQAFSPRELRFVFLHELAHLKRRDLPLSGLIAILQAIHWFNPLVWIGFGRWRMDRELACDAMALEVLGAGQQRDYGETILRLLQNMEPQSTSPALIGISEDKRQLQQRIGLIARFKPSPRFSALALVLLGGLAAICLTDARGQKPDSPKQPAALAPAAGKPGAPQAEPTPVATVVASGRIHTLKITVLDAVTKRPVAGAEIASWQGGDLPKTTTDVLGVATLRVPVDIPNAERMRLFDVNVVDPRYAQRSVIWIATAGRVRETLPTDYEFQVSAGITIGGLVRDEHGTPVVGAKVLISGSDYKGVSRRPGEDITSHQEFPAARTDEASSPVTNEQGAWQKEHFPADLTQVSIEVIRPGGARARFVADNGSRPQLDRSTSIDLGAVKAGGVVLTLKDGFTVQGIVVDEANRPLSGVQLRARDAASRNQPYAFLSGLDGRFTLEHWDVGSVLVTAEKEGFQTKSIALATGRDAGPGRIVLPPAKPLVLRLVGENDAPIAGAKLQTDLNPSPDQIVSWAAMTDADGRAVWSAAPDKPVTIWIQPPVGSVFPYRTVRLVADGTDHVIRLRPGADQSVRVRFRVVDAETGAPVPKFEVWRRMPNEAFKPWGEPAGKGEFTRALATAEMPNGFTPNYRLQVRAAGYAGWSSDTLDFYSGDQDHTLKLVKGESTLANEPPPSRLAGLGLDGDRDPQLVLLAGAVARLLETGDVDAFVRAATASLDDWKRLLPAGGSEKDLPLGPNPQPMIERRQKAVAASARHVLELAARTGLSPGKMRFVVKSVNSPTNSSSSFRIGAQAVMTPSALALRVVLAGEPVGRGDGKPPRGDYTLSIGNARKFPGGWRTDEGVRWAGLPAGLTDETVRRELAIANRIAPTTFGDERILSGMDDPALLQFGEIVTDLIRQRSAAAFVKAARLTRDETAAFYLRTDRAVTAELDEAYARNSNGLTAAAEAMVALQERMGIDLRDARLTVKQVHAERPYFMRFGKIDGVGANSLRVVIAAESSRNGQSGQPLAGNYTVAIGNALRVGDRWVLVEDKLRFQEFPQGVVSGAEQKHLEFENYVAEHRTLPPGHPAPEVSFIKLGDNSASQLSAYRGKVVVLEFWATWCGPCQEPMEKLQRLREAHPDWNDRVEVIALSLDDKAEEARRHLEKKSWSKTLNVWAGPGAWQAPAPLAFRVRGVPTSYVLDREGRVVQAGHPASMDFGRIVEAELKKTAR